MIGEPQRPGLQVAQSAPEMIDGDAPSPRGLCCDEASPQKRPGRIAVHEQQGLGSVLQTVIDVV